MREALYRKHRPKRLEDVVGQPHITQTLQNAIDSDRISHGYLFAGPRGVGKTSVARILAHQINDFSYDSKHNNLLDIIEIDAASNRRIDEIRELRDKIHTAPVSGKYKVYIIDEVHMLTKEAFNALLKTLEEPPAHVVFILATTEIHKVPETIISRTQHFTFKSVNNESVANHLEAIAKEEGIIINNDAIQSIANYGQGSFRDSIGLLDQLSSLPEINIDSINALLGLPPHQLVYDILDALRNNELSELLNLLDNSRSSGISPGHLSTAIIDEIKVNTNQLPSEKLISLALQLLKTKSSSDPERYLELTLIDYLYSNTTNLPINNMQSVVNNSISDTVDSESTKKPKNKPSSMPKPKSTQNKQIEKEPVSLDEATWSKILDQLKKQYNTLYGITRMGRTEINGDTLTIYVRFPFHQKRLTEDKNYKIIYKVASEVLNRPIIIKVEIDKNTPNKAIAKDKPQDTDISEVSKIFEGAELLES